MTYNYKIIPTGQLYPLFSGLYVITGTPVLYYKHQSMIIIGDIHLGQESSLNPSTEGKKAISSSTKSISDLISYVCSLYDVDKILFNGDIKHHTNKIDPQEIAELQHLFALISESNLDPILIKGNHDRFLDIIIAYLDLKNDKIQNWYQDDSVYITHGHLSFDLDVQRTIILSHEHPAYNLWGSNHTRIKLPAFVTLKSKNMDVIILPPANSISTGTSYPIRSNNKFLSPFLQEHADRSTMEIFPFDYELGLFEIPPPVKWRSKRH